MATFRNPYGCGMVEEIDAHAKAAIKPKAKEERLNELAFFLLNYERSLYEPETSLCQRGLSNPGGSLKAIEKARSLDASSIFAATLKFWKDQYVQATGGQRDHRHRRQKLEEIIRFLQSDEKSNEKSDDSGIVNLLAQAYLNRGLLYRPKGFSIPARKIEALSKAMRLSLKVIQKDSSNLDALRTYAVAGLELLRTGEAVPENCEEHLLDDRHPSQRDDGRCKKKSFEDYLYDAADALSNAGIEGPQDVSILLKNAEIYEDSDGLEAVLAEEDDWERPFDLKLFQARAALLLDREDDSKERVLESLEAPPQALSDPFWDDLVDFIGFAKKRGADSVWKSAARKAQALCAAREAKIGNNIYLSWYWSQQEPLYDFAFLACDNAEEKARIADSLKSRPTLRYKALADLEGKNEFVREILKQEYESRDNRYLRRKPGQIKLPAKPPVHFDRLPEEWMAVHFFLNQKEQKGHALIHDGAQKQWSEQIFSFASQHEAFLRWEESYSIGDRSQSAEALVALCREMGKRLPFLFDETTLPKDRPVLFVPHGFLHHLPFHAAIGPQDEIFLESHVCRYLPAWHLLPQAPTNSGGDRILMAHFPDNPFSNLQSADLNWTRMEEKADKENLQNALQSSPALLVLLCHGEGDILNPFRSRLKLHGGDLTLLEMLESMPNLGGARVLLGACESDMAPPQGHAVDEHLSLSMLFLSQGASEVLAGLWEIGADKVNDSYGDFCQEDEDLAESLNEWQKDNIEEYLKGAGQDGSFLSSAEEMLAFYKIVPFRVAGLPGSA